MPVCFHKSIFSSAQVFAYINSVYHKSCNAIKSCFLFLLSHIISSFVYLPAADAKGNNAPPTVTRLRVSAIDFLLKPTERYVVQLLSISEYLIPIVMLSCIIGCQLLSLSYCVLASTVSKLMQVSGRH